MPYFRRMHTPALLRNMLVALVAMAVLYLGRTVFIPLLYSLLVALVLYPLVAKLERGGVPRWRPCTPYR